MEEAKNGSAVDELLGKIDGVILEHLNIVKELKQIRDILESSMSFEVARQMLPHLYRDNSKHSFGMMEIVVKIMKEYADETQQNALKVATEMLEIKRKYHARVWGNSKN